MPLTCGECPGYGVRQIKADALTIKLCVAEPIGATKVRFHFDTDPCDVPLETLRRALEFYGAHVEALEKVIAMREREEAQS